MTVSPSKIILFILALATLGLTWYTYQTEQQADIVQPTRNYVGDPVARSAIKGDESAFALQRRPLIESKGDLFAMPIQPTPKQTKVVKATYSIPKKVDVLPPLPFKYIGRWVDNEKQAVILDYHGEILAVQVGDVVARDYQLESVQETGNFLKVEFLMLSRDIRQTLQARVEQ